jgi:hypothetical protein
VADWVTISSLATAGGTLVLATATFASVRTGNRSARAAELALQEQRRPVLVDSRGDDPGQTIGFVDGRSLDIAGGTATIEASAEAAYLALSLRNMGAGLAVLQGWQVQSTQRGDPPSQEAWRELAQRDDAPNVDEFRSLTRDQYVPAGDLGVWQGAVRDPADPILEALKATGAARPLLVLDLFYTDQVGGQRTISRFGLTPGDQGWVAAAARHWYLDADAPR